MPPTAEASPMDAIIAAMKEWAEKHDAGGTPITAGYSHGPGGNLTFPGTDPRVFQTVVGNRGILGMLPVVPTTSTNPTYTVVTGVKGDVGSEANGVCDDAPTAGLMKAGTITSVFGRYMRSTPELELNRLGQFVDRADPMDLTMVGTPIWESGLFSTGPGNAAAPADLLRNEISRKFWELGVSLNRLLSQQLWVGNPANNSAGGGYQEVTGIDLLVNTGYVDIITGTALPSIDSQIMDFNYQTPDSQGTQLVSTMTYMYRYFKDLAFRTGVAPVNMRIAMRPEVFYEITAVWPCSYLTYRCSFTGAGDLVVEATEAVRMRDEMRTGNYLLIDGERVPVVLDDGIPYVTQTTNGNVTSGCIASDIYFLPLSILGGNSTLYLEHFDYNNPSLRAALADDNNILARVEGPWITVPRQSNFCMSWQTKIEPRVVLRTPWLAGKIQNVQVCPELMTRSPFPADPYFVNGGLTERAAPSYSTLWS